MTKNANSSDFVGDETSILVGMKKIVMYHPVSIPPAIIKPFTNLSPFKSLWKIRHE